MLSSSLVGSRKLACIAKSRVDFYQKEQYNVILKFSIPVSGLNYYLKRARNTREIY
jgi:hypothetical protein